MSHLSWCCFAKFTHIAQLPAIACTEISPTGHDSDRLTDRLTQSVPCVVDNYKVSHGQTGQKATATLQIHHIDMHASCMIGLMSVPASCLWHAEHATPLLAQAQWLLDPTLPVAHRSMSNAHRSMSNAPQLCLAKGRHTATHHQHALMVHADCRPEPR